MPRRKRDRRDSLTDLEERLLADLLLGKRPKGPLRAATHLVKLGICKWVEPDGVLALTPAGRRFARELWPDTMEVPPTEDQALAAAQTIRVSPQLALNLPGALAERPRPVDALTRALEGVPNAKEAVQLLLEHYPNGRGLPTASQKALESMGLPGAVVRRVTSAFELARACYVDRKSLDSTEPVLSSEDMAKTIWISQSVENLEVEHVWCAALDPQRRLLSVHTVAVGGQSVVAIAIRDLLTPAVRARASSCFLAHNHPAGDLTVTDKDIRLTQRVHHAAQDVLGIAFLDHLVLAPSGEYVSMRDEGLI